VVVDKRFCLFLITCTSFKSRIKEKLFLFTKLSNDEPVKSHYDTIVCHSRESGNPLLQTLTSSWIPAFAGMTTFYAANIK